MQVGLKISGVMVMSFLVLGCVPKRVPESNEETSVTTNVAPPKPAAPETSTRAEAKASSDLQDVTVHFELDSSSLVDSAQLSLAALASKIKKQPSVALEVEGHTCEIGTEEYNLVLGNKRAEAARRYLRDLGVDDRQMSTVSYGELHPLSTATTPEALAANRRAEVKVRSRE